MTSVALLLLSASMGGDPLPELLHQDFRGGRFTEPVLKRVGPAPKKFMKGEPDGLRITLPGKEPLPPVGVSSRLAVHGDFEITLTYQNLRVEKPTSGYGAGVSLWIAMEAPTADTATLARFVRPKQGDVLATDHAFKDGEGKRRHKERRLPTDVKAGRLRLARSGSTLFYLATHGNDADFQELRREEFGSEPLKGVRAAADTGGALVEVDVRLIDLEIRANELSASPVSAQTGRTVWGIGLVIGAGLALGGVIYWRGTRRRSRATA